MEINVFICILFLLFYFYVIFNVYYLFYLFPSLLFLCYFYYLKPFGFVYEILCTNKHLALFHR